MKVMIIPGNGNTDVSENWFPYVKNNLEKLGFKVIAKNMPDPDLARKMYWLPFIKQELSGDENSILIGHSSGALAILRFLEANKAFGAIIIGASHTDLGDEKERLSGYFDGEWRWDDIKHNAKWIVQFASTDDPYVPIEEARYIKNKIGSEYHEYVDEGHFGSDKGKTQFPEILEIIKRKSEVFP